MNSHHSTRILLNIVIALLCLTSPSQSQSKDLTASVFDIVPYSYYTKDGKLTGIMPDFIKLLSTEMGINIKIYRLPYTRMLKSLNTGDSDFAIFFHSSATEHIVDSLIKIRELDSVIVGRKGTEIHHYDDLKELKISIPRGIFYNVYFDDDKSLKITKVIGYKNAARLLASGRTDVIAGPLEIIAYEMARLGPTKVTLGTPYRLASNEIWLRFSKNSKNPHLKLQLTKSTKKLLEKGDFERLFDQYFSMQP